MPVWISYCTVFVYLTSTVLVCFFKFPSGGGNYMLQCTVSAGLQYSALLWVRFVWQQSYGGKICLRERGRGARYTCERLAVHREGGGQGVKWSFYVWRTLRDRMQ